MSGPIDDRDGSTSVGGISAIEVREGRTTRIGESRILRVLPTKRRRTIGPWCFVDLMAPDDVENPPPLEIGPHPHIGLATVTWLFSGSVLHSDSLGTQQSIRPGQLNLMTASHGIAHAEEGIDAAPADATGGIVGVQMWLAQPESDRNGGSDFQHIAELPTVDLGTGAARVLIGELGAERSPALFNHPTVGLDVEFRAPVDIPTNATFEYGVVPIDRPIRVADVIVEPGSLAVIPPGFEQLRVESRDGPGRVMLLGGEPLGVPIKMWWNFVARTADEITEAWRDWQAHDEDRFGPVTSSLPRIDAPPPPWVRQDR
jgi:redox-sensitive bicupin YhaK (pirin superfamily)